MNAIRPHHVPAITLTTAFEGIVESIDSDALIHGIRLNSREISAGELYVALPGTRVHGGRYANAAIAAGAVAILTDAQGAELIGNCDVPVITVEDVRAVMAKVAARIFGQPAKQLELFGVTGTNGKTTTVALLESALSSCGRRVGTIGTLGFRLAGEDLDSTRSTVTTPESPDLQALLAVMAEGNSDVVALEVSSHALKLARVDALQFTVAAFLNLGRDHLDFHSDLDDYFETKASLFTPQRTRAAVVWVDDEYGREVARRSQAAGLPTLTVGMQHAADYRLSDYRELSPLGGQATLVTPTQCVTITLALPGWHNMVDAAIAVAMAQAAGYSLTQVLPGLARAQVPGRMQALDLPGPAPTVIIDFAHTPQAVAATLDALQGFDKVITVVGCGGDRDAAKRPEMGKAAALRSDLVIITDDNPRSEDPAAIRAATHAGAVGHRAAITEVADRAQAIAFALMKASRGSVVAILGKGHEQGQQIGGSIVPFDDARVATAAWLSMEGRGR